MREEVTEELQRPCWMCGELLYKDCIGRYSCRGCDVEERLVKLVFNRADGQYYLYGYLTYTDHEQFYAPSPDCTPSKLKWNGELRRAHSFPSL